MDRLDTMREIAMDYYELAPDRVKDLAEKFYEAMDYDGDGKISPKEFMAFMREQGFEQYRDRYFFEDLDRKGRGHLDFKDVMTLYYIMKSGRPFCEGCGELITSIYFTCVHCFQNSSMPFSLCPGCYLNNHYSHKHRFFLDNYTMLETQRIENLVARKASQCERAALMSSSMPSSSNSQPGETVPESQRSSKKKKLEYAFKALDAALKVATIASTAACTIC
ncbi:EF-hand domain [Dillenia turbinata]|uniref:EF-hand domain n=1 Tax=Dillenia turbinata TaxID=194707 RepID=A0AAN8UQS6_9MAGN